MKSVLVRIRVMRNAFFVAINIVNVVKIVEKKNSIAIDIGKIFVLSKLEGAG